MIMSNKNFIFIFLNINQKKKKNPSIQLRSVSFYLFLKFNNDIIILEIIKI